MGGADSDPFRELAYFTLLQQQQQQQSPYAAMETVPSVATGATGGASDAAGDDAQLIQQLESTRSYEECRQLVISVLPRAASAPPLLATAAMRLAIWGSREFREQQHQQREGTLREIQATVEHNLHGGPAPGRALGDGTLRPYQMDERCAIRVWGLGFRV